MSYKYSKVRYNECSMIKESPCKGRHRVKYEFQNYVISCNWIFKKVLLKYNSEREIPRKWARLISASI